MASHIDVGTTPLLGEGWEDGVSMSRECESGVPETNHFFNCVCEKGFIFSVSGAFSRVMAYIRGAYTYTHTIYTYIF